MTCKNCNNKLEIVDDFGKLIDICTLDGHEVRKSIESCNKDTDNK